MHTRPKRKTPKYFHKFISLTLSIIMGLYPFDAGLLRDLNAEPVVSPNLQKDIQPIGEVIAKPITEIILKDMQKGKSFKGDKDLEVILIRDLHCQEEAQVRISKAIQQLYEEGGLKNIFMEGAQGPVRTILYEAFPDEGVRKKVGREFVKEGYLTGAEYAAIEMGLGGSIELYGVEDAALYIENLKVFRETRRSEAELKKELERIGEGIESIKKARYSNELKQMDSLMGLFDGGKADINEVLEVIEKITDRTQNLSENLKPLMKFYKEQKTLSKDKMEEELKNLTEELQKKLVKEELKTVVEKTLKFRLGQIGTGEYLETLKEKYIANQVHEKPFEERYPQLETWRRIALEQEKLDIQALWKELKNWVKEFRLTQSQKEGLEGVVKADDEWHLVSKLIHLELTREDLKVLKERDIAQELSRFNAQMKEIDPALSPANPEIEELIKSAWRFYELAEKRDEVLAKNVLETIHQPKEGKNPLKGLLITGGFHTEGIQQILEREGVSYVTWTPEVRNQVLTSRYEEIMMNEEYYGLNQTEFSDKRVAWRVQGNDQIRRMLSTPVLLSEVLGQVGRGEGLDRIRVKILQRMVEAQRDVASINEILNSWMGGEGNLDLIRRLTPSDMKLLFEAMDPQRVFAKLTDLNPRDGTQAQMTVEAVRAAYQDTFPALLRLTEEYFKGAEKTVEASRAGPAAGEAGAEGVQGLPAEQAEAEPEIQVPGRLEGLKLKSGKAGIWMGRPWIENGERRIDVSDEEKLDAYKKEFEKNRASEIVTIVEGVPGLKIGFDLEGGNLTDAQKQRIKELVLEMMQEMTPQQHGFLVKQAEDRQFRGQSGLIVVSLMQDSVRPFENHLNSGFFGISQQIFDTYIPKTESYEPGNKIPEELREKIIKVGMWHQMRHEEGIADDDEDQIVKGDVIYAAELGVAPEVLIESGIFDTGKNSILRNWAPILLDFLRFNGHQFLVDYGQFPTAPRVVGPGKVEFVYYAPAGSDVRLAGDFTRWKGLIKLEPSANISRGGLVQYAVTVEGLYNVHPFKFIVNDQWISDDEVETISPYVQKTTADGHSVKNSLVWAPRPLNDPYLRRMAAILVERLEDPYVSEESKQQIALNIPPALVATSLTRNPALAVEFIRYAMKNTYGLAPSVLSDRLERVLDVFGTRSPELLETVGFGLAKYVGDLNALDFLMNYAHLAATPFEVNRKRYSFAPRVTGLGEVEFSFYAPAGSKVYLAGGFTNWEESAIRMNPHPDRRRGGMILYTMKVSKLYGPQFFKFKVVDPLGRSSWSNNVEAISPYFWEENYGNKNSVVWSTRSAQDPFVKGLMQGLIERMGGSDGKDQLSRNLVAEHFPIADYPQYAEAFFKSSRQVMRQYQESSAQTRAPPEDYERSVLYASLRNYADPERGVSGINGFVEWAQKNLMTQDGKSVFSHVLIFPPFPSGEVKRLGTWGSPWSPKDFLDTDPMIGSPEEVRAGIRKLHELGIKVILDMPWHSTSWDHTLRSEHPDWFLDQQPGFQRTEFAQRYVDIVPLDLKKPEVRDYVKNMMAHLVEFYGYDGVRFDGLANKEVVTLDAYNEIVTDLQRRFPNLFIVAEGREPALHNTSHAMYGWDAMFTLNHILRHIQDVKLEDFIDLLKRMQAGVRSGMDAGVKLMAGRTQDNTFLSRSEGAGQALLFGLPMALPTVWMMEVSKGSVQGQTQFPDNENRQVKVEAFRVAEPLPEKIQYLNRVIELLKTNPALALGDFQVVDLLYRGNPNGQLAYLRSFGTDRVMVLGDIWSNGGSVRLYAPFMDSWDLSSESEEQKFWLGDLITGQGIQLSLKDAKDLQARRKTLEVSIPKDRTLYLSFAKWDPSKHVQADKKKEGPQFTLMNTTKTLEKRMKEASAAFRQDIRTLRPDAPSLAYEGFYNPLYVMYWALMVRSAQNFVDQDFESIKTAQNADYSKAERIYDWIRYLTTADETSSMMKGDLSILESTGNKVKSFARSDGQDAFIVAMNTENETVEDSQIRLNNLSIEGEASYSILTFDPETMTFETMLKVPGYDLLSNGLTLPDLDPMASRMVMIRKNADVQDDFDALVPDAFMDHMFFSPFTYWNYVRSGSRMPGSGGQIGKAQVQDVFVTKTKQIHQANVIYDDGSVRRFPVVAEGYPEALQEILDQVKPDSADQQEAIQWIRKYWTGKIYFTKGLPTPATTSSDGSLILIDLDFWESLREADEKDPQRIHTQFNALIHEMGEAVARQHPEEIEKLMAKAVGNPEYQRVLAENAEWIRGDPLKQWHYFLRYQVQDQKSNPILTQQIQKYLRASVQRLIDEGLARGIRPDAVLPEIAKEIGKSYRELRELFASTDHPMLSPLSKLWGASDSLAVEQPSSMTGMFFRNIDEIVSPNLVYGLRTILRTGWDYVVHSRFGRIVRYLLSPLEWTVRAVGRNLAKLVVLLTVMGVFLTVSPQFARAEEPSSWTDQLSSQTELILGGTEFWTPTPEGREHLSEYTLRRGQQRFDYNLRNIGLLGEGLLRLDLELGNAPYTYPSSVDGHLNLSREHLTYGGANFQFLSFHPFDVSKLKLGLGARLMGYEEFGFGGSVYGWAELDNRRIRLSDRWGLVLGGRLLGEFGGVQGVGLSDDFSFRIPSDRTTSTYNLYGIGAPWTHISLTNARVMLDVNLAPVILRGGYVGSLEYGAPFFGMEHAGRFETEFDLGRHGNLLLFFQGGRLWGDNLIRSFYNPDTGEINERDLDSSRMLREGIIYSINGYQVIASGSQNLDMDSYVAELKAVLPVTRWLSLAPELAYFQGPPNLLSMPRELGGFRDIGTEQGGQFLLKSTIFWDAIFHPSGQIGKAAVKDVVIRGEGRAREANVVYEGGIEKNYKVVGQMDVEEIHRKIPVYAGSLLAKEFQFIRDDWEGQVLFVDGLLTPAMTSGDGSTILIDRKFWETLGKREESFGGNLRYNLLIHELGEAIARKQLFKIEMIIGLEPEEGAYGKALLENRDWIYEGIANQKPSTPAEDEQVALRKWHYFLRYRVQDQASNRPLTHWIRRHLRQSVRSIVETEQKEGKDPSSILKDVSILVGKSAGELREALSGRVDEPVLNALGLSYQVSGASAEWVGRLGSLLSRLGRFILGLGRVELQTTRLSNNHPNKGPNPMMRTAEGVRLNDFTEMKKLVQSREETVEVEGEEREIPTLLIAGRPVKIHLDRDFLVGLQMSVEEFLTFLNQAMEKEKEANGTYFTSLPDDIFIGLLDESSSLFENRTGEGFLGINKALLDVRLPKADRDVILQSGLIRGLRHEALVLERPILWNEYMRRFYGDYLVFDNLFESPKTIAVAWRSYQNRSGITKTLARTEWSYDKALMRRLLADRGRAGVDRLRNSLNGLLDPESSWFGFLQRASWSRSVVAFLKNPFGIIGLFGTFLSLFGLIAVLSFAVPVVFAPQEAVAAEREKGPVTDGYNRFEWKPIEGQRIGIRTVLDSGLLGEGKEDDFAKAEKDGRVVYYYPQGDENYLYLDRSDGHQAIQVAVLNMDGEQMSPWSDPMRVQIKVPDPIKIFSINSASPVRDANLINFKANPRFDVEVQTSADAGNFQVLDGGNAAMEQYMREVHPQLVGLAEGRDIVQMFREGFVSSYRSKSGQNRIGLWNSNGARWIRVRAVDRIAGQPATPWKLLGPVSIGNPLEFYGIEGKVSVADFEPVPGYRGHYRLELPAIPSGMVLVVQTAPNANFNKSEAREYAVEAGKTKDVLLTSSDAHTHIRYSLRTSDPKPEMISDWSNPEKLSSPIVVPKAPSPKQIRQVSDSGIILWNPVPGARFYRVEGRRENGEWEEVGVFPQSEKPRARLLEPWAKEIRIITIIGGEGKNPEIESTPSLIEIKPFTTINPLDFFQGGPVDAVPESMIGMVGPGQIGKASVDQIQLGRGKDGAVVYVTYGNIEARSHSVVREIASTEIQDILGDRLSPEVEFIRKYSGRILLVDGLMTPAMTSANGNIVLFDRTFWESLREAGPDVQFNGVVHEIGEAAGRQNRDAVQALLSEPPQGEYAAALEKNADWIQEDLIRKWHYYLRYKVQDQAANEAFTGIIRAYLERSILSLFNSRSIHEERIDDLIIRIRMVVGKSGQDLTDVLIGSDQPLLRSLGVFLSAPGEARERALGLLASLPENIRTSVDEAVLNLGSMDLSAVLPHLTIQNLVKILFLFNAFKERGIRDIRFSFRSARDIEQMDHLLRRIDMTQIAEIAGKENIEDIQRFFMNYLGPTIVDLTTPGSLMVSMDWIGDTNFKQNYNFWLSRYRGNRDWLHYNVQQEADRTGRSFAEVVAGVVGNQALSEKAYQEHRDTPFDYVLIGGGTGSSKVAEQFSMKGRSQNVVIVASVNDDGGDTRKKMDAIRKSDRFGVQIIPPGDIINAWTGFASKIKNDFLGMRVNFGFKDVMSSIKSRHPSLSMMKVSSGATNMAQKVEALANRAGTPRPLREAVLGMLDNVKQYNQMALRDSEALFSMTIAKLLEAEWKEDRAAILREKMSFLQALLDIADSELDLRFTTSVQEQRTIARDFRETFENYLYPYLMTQYAELNRAMPYYVTLAEKLAAQYGEDLPEDWMFFINNVLNMARLVDQEFIIPGVFKLHGSSLRNLLILSLWVNLGFIRKPLEGERGGAIDSRQEVKADAVIQKMLGLQTGYVTPVSHQFATLSALLEYSTMMMGGNQVSFSDMKGKGPVKLKIDGRTQELMEDSPVTESIDHSMVTFIRVENGVRVIVSDEISKARESKTIIENQDGTIGLVSEGPIDQLDGQTKGEGIRRSIGSETVTLYGRRVIEQDHITQSHHHSRITEVTLEGGVRPKANFEVLREIQDAKAAIVMGPGSLYTSLLPNLLMEGLTDALIQRSDIPRVLLIGPTHENESMGSSVEQVIETMERSIKAVLGEDVKLNQVFSHIVISDWSKMNPDQFAAVRRKAEDGLKTDSEGRFLLSGAKYERGLIGASDAEIRRLREKGYNIVGADIAELALSEQRGGTMGQKKERILYDMDRVRELLERFQADWSGTTGLVPGQIGQASVENVTVERIKGQEVAKVSYANKEERRFNVVDEIRPENIQELLRRGKIPQEVEFIQKYAGRVILVEGLPTPAMASSDGKTVIFDKTFWRELSEAGEGVHFNAFVHEIGEAIARQNPALIRALMASTSRDGDYGTALKDNASWIGQDPLKEWHYYLRYKVQNKEDNDSLTRLIRQHLYSSARLIVQEGKKAGKKDDQIQSDVLNLLGKDLNDTDDPELGKLLAGAALSEGVATPGVVSRSWFKRAWWLFIMIPLFAIAITFSFKGPRDYVFHHVSEAYYQYILDSHPVAPVAIQAELQDAVQGEAETVSVNFQTARQQFINSGRTYLYSRVHSDGSFLSWDDGNTSSYGFDKGMVILGLVSLYQSEYGTPQDLEMAQRIGDNLVELLNLETEHKGWRDSYELNGSRKDMNQAVSSASSGLMGLTALMKANPGFRERYQESAHDVAEFVLGLQVTDGNRAGAFYGGYDGDGDRFSWMSTEHAFLAANALIQYGLLTGDQRYVEAGTAAIQWAVKPVSEGGMWTGDHFLTGVRPNGETNQDQSLPQTHNVWAYQILWATRSLTGIDPSQYNPMPWLSRNFLTISANYHGLPISGFNDKVAFRVPSGEVFSAETNSVDGRIMVVGNVTDSQGRRTDNDHLIPFLQDGSAQFIRDVNLELTAGGAIGFVLSGDPAASEILQTLLRLQNPNGSVPAIVGSDALRGQYPFDHRHTNMGYLATSLAVMSGGNLFDLQGANAGTVRQYFESQNTQDVRLFRVGFSAVWEREGENQTFPDVRFDGKNLRINYDLHEGTWQQVKSDTSTFIRAGEYIDAVDFDLQIDGQTPQALKFMVRTRNGAFYGVEMPNPQNGHKTVSIRSLRYLWGGPAGSESQRLNPNDIDSVYFAFSRTPQGTPVTGSAQLNNIQWNVKPAPSSIWQAEGENNASPDAVFDGRTLRVRYDLRRGSWQQVQGSVDSLIGRGETVEEMSFDFDVQGQRPEFLKVMAQTKNGAFYGMELRNPRVGHMQIPLHTLGYFWGGPSDAREQSLNPNDIDTLYLAFSRNPRTPAMNGTAFFRNLRVGRMSGGAPVVGQIGKAAVEEVRLERVRGQELVRVNYSNQETGKFRVVGEIGTSKVQEILQSEQIPEEVAFIRKYAGRVLLVEGLPTPAMSSSDGNIVVFDREFWNRLIEVGDQVVFNALSHEVGEAIARQNPALIKAIILGTSTAGPYGDALIENAEWIGGSAFRAWHYYLRYKVQNQQNNPELTALIRNYLYQSATRIIREELRRGRSDRTIQSRIMSLLGKDLNDLYDPELRELMGASAVSDGVSFPDVLAGLFVPRVGLLAALMTFTACSLAFPVRITQDEMHRTYRGLDHQYAVDLLGVRPVEIRSELMDPASEKPPFLSVAFETARSAFLERARTYLKSQIRSNGSFLSWDNGNIVSYGFDKGIVVLGLLSSYRSVSGSPEDLDLARKVGDDLVRLLSLETEHKGWRDSYGLDGTRKDRNQSTSVSSSGLMALTGLMMADPDLKPKYETAAREAADFILGLQVQEGNRAGAFYGGYDPQGNRLGWISTEHVFLAANALIQYGKFTNDPRYIEAGKKALAWVVKPVPEGGMWTGENFLTGVSADNTNNLDQSAPQTHNLWSYQILWMTQSVTGIEARKYNPLPWVMRNFMTRQMNFRGIAISGINDRVGFLMPSGEIYYAATSSVDGKLAVVGHVTNEQGREVKPDALIKGLLSGNVRRIRNVNLELTTAALFGLIYNNDPDALLLLRTIVQIQSSDGKVPAIIGSERVRNRYPFDLRHTNLGYLSTAMATLSGANIFDVAGENDHVVTRFLNRAEIQQVDLPRTSISDRWTSEGENNTVPEAMFDGRTLTVNYDLRSGTWQQVRIDIGSLVFPGTPADFVSFDLNLKGETPQFIKVMVRTRTGEFYGYEMENPKSGPIVVPISSLRYFWGGYDVFERTIDATNIDAVLFALARDPQTSPTSGTVVFNNLSFRTNSFFPGPGDLPLTRELMLNAVVPQRAQNPAATTSNFGLSVEGEVSGRGGIDNKEVGRQVSGVLEAAGLKAGETRLEGKVLSFRVDQIKGLQGETTLGRLGVFVGGAAYQGLEEGTRELFEGTRLVILEGQTSVAQSKEGSSYAHYGEAGGPTVFIGKDLLDELLEKDPESLAVLIRVEMNRRQYRAEHGGKDPRSSREVVRDTGVDEGAIQKLTESIARAEARAILAKWGEDRVSETIIKASEALDQMRDQEAEVDQVLLGKLRGKILSAVVEELALRMKARDQALEGLVKVSAEKLEKERIRGSEQIVVETLSKAVEKQIAKGELPEAIGINLLMNEAKLYLGGTKTVTIALNDRTSQAVSQMVGKRSGDVDWVMVDLRRNTPQESIPNLIQESVNALLNGEPIKEKGREELTTGVSVERLNLKGVEVIHVSRGRTSLVALQAKVKAIGESLDYFQDRSKKDNPIAIDPRLLEQMSVGERRVFVKQYRNRLAVLDGAKVEGLSEQDQTKLMRNWEAYQALDGNYQVAMMLSEEGKPVAKAGNASILPIKAKQIDNISYVTSVAGYIADIGKEAAKLDPEASRMLRQLLRELFEEGQIPEEVLEEVSFTKILEDPEQFLFPPIKTQGVTDVESYLRAQKAIDVMA